MNKTYTQTFEGWSYIEIPLEQATDLIARLVEKGAGFAHTSEPWDGTRRIYFASKTSTAVVEEFIRG
jgi:hypothetical protein